MFSPILFFGGGANILRNIGINCFFFFNLVEMTTEANMDLSFLGGEFKNY